MHDIAKSSVVLDRVLRGTFGSAIFAAVVMDAQRGNHLVGGVRIAIEERVRGSGFFGGRAYGEAGFLHSQGSVLNR